LALHPRPEIEKLPQAVHGGLDYDELKSWGLKPEDVLDFSVSCNPYPPPPEVEESLKGMLVNCYPDSGSTRFRERLAVKLDITPEKILAGSGTTELIRLIALAYLEKGDKVIIPQPTYGEHELACRLFGVNTVMPRSQPDHNFQFDAGEIAGLIRKHLPRAVFLCQPNNPTGHYFARVDIETMLQACGNTLLVLDEAYINFVDNAWPSLDLVADYNLIILRSMTKDYSLTGLRLGYAIARRDIIDVLQRVCPPWNVNIAAQQAGTAALDNEWFLEQSLREVREAKQHLVEELIELGFSPLPSQANFFMIKVGDGKAFRCDLLRQGFLVRDCASFGLPEYIRMAPRTLPECRKLIATLRGLKQKGKLDGYH
jgi:histidinol-phosphate aminotransferase